MLELKILNHQWSSSIWRFEFKNKDLCSKRFKLKKFWVGRAVEVRIVVCKTLYKPSSINRYSRKFINDSMPESEVSVINYTKFLPYKKVFGPPERVWIKDFDLRLENQRLEHEFGIVEVFSSGWSCVMSWSNSHLTVSKMISSWNNVIVDKIIETSMPKRYSIKE